MNKIENRKFILTRLDSYIEGSQSKSNLYLALNTIILGGVITILSALNELECTLLLNILLLIIALASILSILITLSAINPYTKSSKSSQSIFFFKDIATHNSFEDYNASLNIHLNSENKLEEDIDSQIYSVSKALNMKYNKLKSVGFILSAEFLLFAIWIIFFLTTK